MKIKVSDKESYEIEFPTDISGKNFKTLLRRLNDIAKLMEKSNGIKITEIKPVIKKKRKYSRRKSNPLDRETIVKLIKIHYEFDKDMKGKQKAMEKVIKGIDYKQFLKKSTYYKRRFNIKPKEVGMKRFPKQNEIWKIKSLKLKK